jgi:hypothetical protein
MSEDYLWDRSGDPEPDVVRLEQLLGELRWSERALQHAGQAQWRRKKQWWMITAAATVLLCLGAAFLVPRMHTMHDTTSWRLSRTGQKPSAVRAGQVIETMGSTGATMESELVGEVDIEPDSRLRVIAAHNDRQRMALDRGTIHASIWAPPAMFVVDTPSAKTVDLGCQYTLSVAKDGKGFLTVEIGWVAFQWHNIESFIPAGAACTTRPGHGPDTPYFLDAPAALTKAVAQFDLTGKTQDLNAALAVARPRDGLTLWHLLQRTKGQERAEVFDRFATLVKLQPNLTREGILSGDRKSMDAAWDALDLGDTSWWREWKRDW